MLKYTYRPAGLDRKAVQLYCTDLKYLTGSVDLFVCSAYQDDYCPTFDSLIGTLYYHFGTSVRELSKDPALSLDDMGIWVSRETGNDKIHRIACVAMKKSPGSAAPDNREMQKLYDTLFFTLRMLCVQGYEIRTIMMGVPGTGNQGIAFLDSFLPLITECVAALTQIDCLERIVMITRDEKQYADGRRVMENLNNRYGTKTAFISYSHKNQKIADLIAAGMEQNGIKPWIDHRQIRNSQYAGDIIRGIRSADLFLFLVSPFSLNSPDCLRELRNAADVGDKRKREMIWPVIVEPMEYPPDFAYILTGLNYYDISSPPSEEKAQKLFEKAWERIK